MLAQRIAIERRRIGWTQNDLAKRLGISRSIVALMESGRSALYVERLLALEAHGFDLPFILWGKRSKTFAGDLLDWALLAKIHRGIREWSDERGCRLTPEKESALLKLLYTHFIEQGSLNKESLAEAMSIAA